MKRFLAFLGLFTAVGCGQSRKTISEHSEKQADSSEQVLSHDRLVARIPEADLYSQHTYDYADGQSITIQNSYNRGGPLDGSGGPYFHYSHLVFFSRIVNGTDSPLHVALTFPSDSLPIPGSPTTLMKVLLPAHDMTIDHISDYDYGVTGFENYLDLQTATTLEQIIPPGQDFLFNMAAIFYQTSEEAAYEERGGRRAEVVLKGGEL